MKNKWKKLLSRDANILTKYLVIQGISRGPTYIYPGWRGMKNQLWAWDKKETTVNYLYSELTKYSNFILKKSLSKPSLVYKYRLLSEELCNSSVKEISDMSQVDVSGLTDKDLAALFLRFCNSFAKIGQTIVMTLEDIQHKLLDKINNPEQATIVTTPIELSIESQEELDRLLLIRFIRKRYSKLFSKDLNYILKNLSKYPGLKKRVESHVNKYCWLPLNFEKELWDTRFFVRLFQAYFKEPYNFEARIKELKNYPAVRKIKRKNVFKKLDSEAKTLASLLEATGYIRLYRANIFSLAFYKAYPILREVAKRTNVDMNILKYYTPPEIKYALLHNKKLSRNRGLARKDSFVILILNNKYKQYEGVAAKRIIKNELPREDVNPTNIIRGQCAYPGVVRGVVKIVSDAREMNKINKGDILVCRETNPDLVIVMGRAGAIVTDEGGLTSHAAIVSREMRKICIIGTKIASKIFKDGDLVEVDANKGIVRRLADK